MFAGAAAALAGSAPASAQCSYEIVAVLQFDQCGPLPNLLWPRAINNANEVVGFYSCGGGPLRPFYWSESTGLALLTLPSGYSTAYFTDINDQGQIVGVRVIPGTGIGHEAALYGNGRWTGLGVLPGGDWSEALAINSDGVVAGFWGNTVTGVPTGHEACIWSGGVMIGLGDVLDAALSEATDVSDDGIVVGWKRSGAGLHTQVGFTYDGAVVTDVPAIDGTVSAAVSAISPSGTLVVQGLASEKVGEDLGFYAWTAHERAVEIVPAIPGGSFIGANRINAAGVIVGAVYDGDSNEAFVFAEGVSRRLQDLLKTDDVVTLGYAGGVNDAGWITAQGTINGSYAAFVLRPLAPAIGDLNDDCAVDATDLGVLLGAWGTTGPLGDLNHDSDVNAEDLNMLLLAWSVG